MENVKFELALGSIVSDWVTGYSGTITARVQYLNGCKQYCVTPTGVGSDGNPKKGSYFDEGQLRLEGEGISVDQKERGGPQRNTPPTM